MKYAVVGGHNKIVPGAAGCGYKEHEVARQMVEKVLYYFSLIGELAYNCTDEAGRTKEQVWLNAVNKTNQCIGSGGLAISIHLNSGAGTPTGTEVLHYDSPVLAQKVSAAIAGVLGIKDRGPKDGKGIGYINSTKSTAILIELCFINNPSDMDKLMKNFDAVARVIVETVTGKKISVPTPATPVSPEAKKEEVPSLPTGIIGVVKIKVDGLYGVAAAEQGDITLLPLEKGKVYNVTANLHDYHRLIFDDKVQVWVRGDNGNNFDLVR